MKKKVLAVLLAGSCVISAMGCGNSTETTLAEEKAAELEAEFEETEEEEAKEEVKEEEAEDEEPEEAEKPEKEEEAAEEERQAKRPGRARKNSGTQAPTELSDDLYDFQVSIEGEVYQFPMWYSDFEDLGWKCDEDVTQTLASDEYCSTNIWRKQGLQVYTDFANMSMNTVSLEDAMVCGITLEEYYFGDSDWEIILPGGIKYKESNADDIRAAYGEPTNVYDSEIYYKMEYQYDYSRSIELYVFKDDDTLKEIHICNMVELEGADNSVDDTVPELVASYELPRELGNDFYEYTAELDGVVYKMPCPVSVLVENGFQIVKENSDMVVASGGVGWVELRYNNQKIRSMVENYAEYATTVENCFATSLEANEYGSKIDLVFPGGIKLGVPEDVVKKAVADFNYEVETSDGGFAYYSICDPDGSVLDRYDIIIYEGVVYSMEISNTVKPE